MRRDRAWRTCGRIFGRSAIFAFAFLLHAGALAVVVFVARPSPGRADNPGDDARFLSFAPPALLGPPPVKAEPAAKREDAGEEMRAPTDLAAPGEDVQPSSAVDPLIDPFHIVASIDPWDPASEATAMPEEIESAGERSANKERMEGAASSGGFTAGVVNGAPGGVPRGTASGRAGGAVGGTGDGAVGGGRGPGGEEGPLRTGGEVSSPIVLHRFHPVYPSAARAARVEGAVRLEAVIRRDGSVGEVRVLQELRLGCTEAAIEALRRWRFLPGRRNGTPVDVYFELTVDFKLN